jgi:hypothetical protein
MVVDLPKRHERYAQASVGEGGTITVVASDGEERVGRVVAIDPGDFTEKAVSADGGFAEYQFPRASPTGKRTAYEHHVRIGGGRVRMDVMVDRDTIASDAVDFAWIDDDALAVMRAGQPPVVVKLP